MAPIPSTAFIGAISVCSLHLLGWNTGIQLQPLTQQVHESVPVPRSGDVALPGSQVKPVSGEQTTSPKAHAAIQVEAPMFDFAGMGQHFVYMFVVIDLILVCVGVAAWRARQQAVSTDDAATQQRDGDEFGEKSSVLQIKSTLVIGASDNASDQSDLRSDHEESTLNAAGGGGAAACTPERVLDSNPADRTACTSVESAAEPSTPTPGSGSRTPSSTSVCEDAQSDTRERIGAEIMSPSGASSSSTCDTRVADFVGDISDAAFQIEPCTPGVEPERPDCPQVAASRALFSTCQEMRAQLSTDSSHGGAAAVQRHAEEAKSPRDSYSHGSHSPPADADAWGSFMSSWGKLKDVFQEAMQLADQAQPKLEGEEGLTEAEASSDQQVTPRVTVVDGRSLGAEFLFGDDA